jgi:arylsulfatase A-like enzyme
MKHLLHLPLLLLAAALLAPAGLLHAADAKQPNILVILTDDLGFSDIGCYGSEIATPNLDRLAANGVRFTQFYNTAKCHSSRVSLLSGRWCRQAGDESLRRAVTIPEVLAPAGYFTAMTGKWHLSKQPTDFGFQRYFGHLSGACNYYKGDKTFRLNGQPWPVPASGFYTTVANVDHALNFLGEARTEKKPWFLYVAFNAPHAPLQPLEADYKKYLGRYDAGWDTIRTARLAKQKQLGLFGRDVEPAPRPPNIPAWDKLAPETRQWEARRMAAYAAMIDRVDQEVGRLLRDVEAKGELDNTLILFFSDNGACPYDRRSTDTDRQPFEPDVTWSDSTGWAWARNSPFRYYKQNQFEGGIATPAIVHWPAGLKLKPGSLVHSPAHLVDVLPTLAEVAGAKVPASFPGRELTPLAGVSLAPILAGQPMTQRPPIHLLFGSDRGLRDGDWKLVSFQSEPWELYNLAEDRTELRNVAARHPDIAGRMVKQWHEMTANVLQATAKERAPVATTATGHLHHEWSNYAGGASTSSRGGDGTGKKKSARKSDAASPLPRARTGTKLKVEGKELVLDCSGADPGLAFDRLGAPLAGGPYALSFRIRSNASGGGELFWTTDAQTILPKGKRLEFAIAHDSQWHDVTLRISETQPLHAFRLDPCAGAGEVRLEGLKLTDSAGKLLQQWP